MMIIVDEFFVETLRENGYDLDYEGLVKIHKESIIKRKSYVNKVNNELIKNIESKQGSKKVNRVCIFTKGPCANSRNCRCFKEELAKD